MDPTCAAPDPTKTEVCDATSDLVTGGGAQSTGLGDFVSDDVRPSSRLWRTAIEAMFERIDALS